MKKLFKRKTVAAVRFLAVVMVLISIALSEMPAYAAETEMGDAFYGNTVIGINAGTSFAAKANTRPITILIITAHIVHLFLSLRQNNDIFSPPFYTMFLFMACS